MLAGVNEQTQSLDVNLAICYDEDDMNDMPEQNFFSYVSALLPICKPIVSTHTIMNM